MNLRQLILRSIICIIGLTMFVYCLPSHCEILSIDQIEDMALATGTNTYGEEGKLIEDSFPVGQKWKDGHWDCKDRAVYCLWLLRQNGYQGELASQKDSMGNNVHMYVIWKDGNCRRPLLKNRDEMKRVEDSLERMGRLGR